MVNDRRFHAHVYLEGPACECQRQNWNIHKNIHQEMFKRISHATITVVYISAAAAHYFMCFWCYFKVVQHEYALIRELREEIVGGDFPCTLILSILDLQQNYGR